ncbi:DUF885 family protein [Caulobacter sp. 17J80-11]|uniref:DUF885 domain-containing protein n=1 Tax=Caulobacter sp. 17J80-11 TaxID=2763502 RepID=UPI001653B13A|nr:DUF885 family protein [Caulobacter sp. 17J80-11]MBC6982584.1 DUF885 family protein [Caulobacter sp. 17J80-11]
MLDRRQLLVSASAASAVYALPAAAASAQTDALTQMLDDTVVRALNDSPQLMTLTGLDTGANAAARGRLDDRSPVGLERSRALFADLAKGLARYDPKTLSGADWVNHQSAAYLADTTLQSFSFPFGDPNVGVASPYIVSQLSGSYRSVPSFLATQHPIGSAADAEAYLSRLSAFAVLLDQETARVKADFAKGAVPPDFVLKTTLTQFAAMTAGPAAQSELVTALTRRTSAKQIPGDWEKRAAAVVEKEVRPALKRQADLLSSALPRSTSDAGVWRLPDGEAYYRFAVRTATTTALSGEEIHRLGLELVADLTAKADAILRARGLTQGTVAQRIAVLRRDPAQLYTNDDAGRAALIADLQRMTGAMQARLPSWFGQLPKASVDVARMPASIEAGASGATYQPPSLDGARPGLFSINLRNLSEWPRFDLPTLVYHEAIPGHHLQNALMIEAAGLPMLRRMPLFSGYSEGWALYAEQLADEMGVYADDPLGRLGYHASMLFRAARLVVDSGIHHKRWSRAQAIAYMSETLGDAETTTTREVERYCVQPGQASSYMLGWRVWTDARTRAQARLGSRFDIRTFHDKGLLAGSMPLDVLARVIDDWA